MSRWPPLGAATPQLPLSHRPAEVQDPSNFIRRIEQDVSTQVESANLIDRGRLRLAEYRVSLHEFRPSRHLLFGLEVCMARDLNTLTGRQAPGGQKQYPRTVYSRLRTRLLENGSRRFSTWPLLTLLTRLPTQAGVTNSAVVPSRLAGTVQAHTECAIRFNREKMWTSF